MNLTKFTFLKPYIDKCLNYLKDNWRKNGDWGCPGDNPDSESNTWSTASILYLFLTMETVGKEFATNAIKWLLNCQNDNGSFPVLKKNKNKDKEFIIPSSFAMLTYYVYLRKNPNDELNKEIESGFNKVLNYILDNKEVIKTELGYEMYSWRFQNIEKKSGTIETAIVLMHLHKILDYEFKEEKKKEIIKVIEGGINWFLNAFNSKWGRDPNDNKRKECPTAYVLMVLNECNINSNEISEAINFLKSRQKNDGSWGPYFEYKKQTGMGLGTEVVAFYFSTPIIIKALFSNDKKKLDNTKIKSIVWLIENMKKGYVTHDVNPEILIWTTRDSIFSARVVQRISNISWLNKIADNYSNLEYNNKELKEENERYKKRMINLVNEGIKNKYNPLINSIIFITTVMGLLIITFIVLVFHEMFPAQSIPLCYTIGIAIISIINKILWDKKI